MVTAALKFASDDKTRTMYATADEARLEILNTLNWYEAHSEYEWPNFTLMGFDFNQSMRFRRALVGDVFTSLQKSGNVNIGARAEGLGTPDSERERAGKRGANGALIIVLISERYRLMNATDNRRMAERKRHCKREDDSDTDVASEDSDKPWWHDQALLTEAMHDLIGRADADIDSYLRGEKSPNALADIVHDGLVSVWNGPVASHGLVPEALEKRRLAWFQGREPSVELGDRPREQRDARGKSTSRER
jgi:hypothetical protein